MNSKHRPDSLRIVVEDVTDTFRIFHCNFELSTVEKQQVSRHEVPCDEEFSAVATEVAQIPGVETVVLRPYGIGIHKGFAFDCDDITEAVEETLLWIGKTFCDHRQPKPVKPKRGAVQVEA